MKTTFVKSGPLNIYTQYNSTFQEEDREAILFVHGFPDNHHSWSYQMNYFKDRYNVAAIDLRGVGRSTAPNSTEEYYIPYHFADFTAVKEFLSADKPIHLVGHDWGAILLWYYLSDVKLNKNVKSYTAVSCPHVSIALNNAQKMGLQNPLEFLNQIFKSWYIYLFQIPFLPEFALENFTEQIWSFAMRKGELPANDAMRNYAKQEIIDMTKNSVNLYRQILRKGIPPLPPHLDTPISLIIAERDLAISPKAYQNHEEYCSHLSKYTLNANHWSHREMPDKVNEIIENQVLSASQVKASA